VCSSDLGKGRDFVNLFVGFAPAQQRKILCCKTLSKSIGIMSLV
jgi:hypothetical protein